MEKARIYELAKELNTTSKRLIEKLAEININVKNHMSLLEADELDALYKHIGVIKHDNKKTDEDKKVVSDNVHIAEKKKDVKKDTKNAPRIIRTTEIILDSKTETSGADVANNHNKNSKNSSKSNYRNDYVKTDSSTSGLRPGFIYETKPEPKKKNVEKSNKIIETPNISTKTPQSGQNEVVDLKKNKNIVDVNKEGKTVAENTIQMESTVVKSNEEIDTAKSNTKDIAHANAESIKNEKDESAPVLTQENIEANKEKEIKKPEEAPVDTKVSEDNISQEQNATMQRSDKPNSQNNNGQKADKPQGQNSSIQKTDKPQGQNNNGQKTDRPQGQYSGQRTDRPQGQNNSGQKTDRPQGQYSGQKTDRPQGQYSGQRTDRPQGQYSGQRTDRPQGQYSGQRTDRPQGQYSGQRTDRPQGQYSGQKTDRPQGQYSGQRTDRPQGQYSGQRTDRPQGQYSGQRTDRPQGQFKSQGLDIPKPDVAVAQEQFDSQRNEARREFQSKDFDKIAKRDENKKKETPKSSVIQNKHNRMKPQKIVIEKKGVSEILSEEYIFNEFYNDDSKKKKVPKSKKVDKAAQTKYIPPKAVLTSITIPETLTVKELAEALKKTSTEIIKKLMSFGVMATVNNDVDFDTATIIAEEYGVKTEKAVQISEEDILFDDIEEEDESKLVPRPPVVVVMGHVDHGKTSLLDAIRSTHVIDSEAGGITQHIGAYMVKAKDRRITFLDTPGHEAFTAMRARGAQVTDIAILVVAADDGVMPQTIEAINHAKAANVSIIVAINKIDKPGANPDRVKQELTEHGIVAEEWGGDAIMVPVSAKKRENIDQLLEMVLLVADMLELKANPDRQAKGTIIEAKLDKERGPVATMLVQRGTLKAGDSIIAGSAFGRIKAMTNDKGTAIKSAGPSMPVEVLGMNEVPDAGEIFYAVTDEKVAKHLVEKRKYKQKEQQYKKSAKVSLEELYNQIKEGKVKDLNLVIKADVQGSLEAVKSSLMKLSNDEVRVNVVHYAVGAITESDVTLAQVSNAIIIGFNVRPGINVTEAAKAAEVDIRLYSIIYKAIEDVQSAMNGLLEPTYKEVVLGHIEIRQVFKVSNVGTIGGAYVTDGKVQRNSEVRVVRDGIVIYEGKLGSLKRFKDDVKEVTQGYECGVSIEKFNDIKEGDVIEAFIMEEVKR
ncbi:translation initiation factor IF-2 [Ruminiclostridium herbifermentans]|uniref:translation initiation factor IF-2 n=1 Tax=Ruminiclostridium herbifermentans TaxID=2488810 RepID=UPI001FD2666D|nr:translation initiation factor IF-2 [Ruminiclostridium herbifermentans]